MFNGSLIVAAARNSRVNSTTRCALSTYSIYAMQNAIALSSLKLQRTRKYSNQISVRSVSAIGPAARWSHRFRVVLRSYVHQTDLINRRAFPSVKFSGGAHEPSEIRGSPMINVTGISAELKRHGKPRQRTEDRLVGNRN